MSQIRLLVLVPHGAAHLKAPHLRPPRAIAHRFERDRRFERPAAREPPGLDCPDWVPVTVVGVRALVAHLAVHSTTNRVDREEEPVPPVVERIEEKPDPLVLQDVEAVAAHLVDHPFGRGRRIPGSYRDVEIRVIEEHPRLGSLGRRRPGRRLGLNEPSKRGNRCIRRFVEPPVDGQRVRHANGSHRGPTGRIARNDVRRLWWWWPVDHGTQPVDRVLRLGWRASKRKHTPTHDDAENLSRRHARPGPSSWPKRRLPGPAELLVELSVVAVSGGIPSTCEGRL